MKTLLFADGKVGFDVFCFMSSNYGQDLMHVVTTEVNAVYQKAQSLGLKVSVFDDDILKKLDGHHYDLGVLAWWPLILKEPLLSYPARGFINFHPSLLPYNRGKHYNFWALVEQVPFGVTIHKVDKGVDTGAVIAQRKIDYDWEDNGGTLFKKAQKTIVELFVDVYPDLREFPIRSVPQNSSCGSFHRASELEEASKIILDKEYTAQKLLNLLRARTFEGHPGCWFENQDGEIFEISIKIKRKNNDI